MNNNTPRAVVFRPAEKIPCGEQIGASRVFPVETKLQNGQEKTLLDAQRKGVAMEPGKR